MTRLVEVQEKKVMSRVKAIEWNIKFEQKELAVRSTALTSDKQDKLTSCWAQGYEFSGTEHPWRAVLKEGVPAGPEGQQHHHGDGPLLPEVKDDHSGTGKVKILPNIMTFTPGNSTSASRQSADDPG